MALDYALLHRTNMGEVGPLPASASTSDASDLAALCHKHNLPFPRSNIDIHIDNDYKSKVYTSQSPISGNVTITTKRDVRFDSVQIVLMGSTRTRVDGVNSGRVVTHTFLKLTMPISSSTYPTPRVLESGQTYTIPFNFVIPSYLTIGACNHHILSDQLQDQHVCLPPTMGKWEKDDMAPEMAVVDYQIKARVYRQPDLRQAKIKVMEACHHLLVLPASAEEPPLNITKHDKTYNLSHSKTLRKNLMTGKLGRLTAEGSQPRAAILGPDGRSITNTSTQIQMTFEPTSTEISPPKVTSVSVKLTAHTYFSAGSIATHPNLGEWTKEAGVEKRGEYQTTVALPSITKSADGSLLARWSQHLTPAARRDSGYASEEDDGTTTSRRGSGSSRKHSTGSSSSSSPTSPILHTTTLSLPIDLSPLLAKKTPIPTFHSCIASRVYTLQLTVSLASGSATNTVSLSLPLQIMVEEDLSLLEGPPSFEAATTEGEVDDYFQPRLLQVPDERYVGGSMLPGYGD